MNNCTSIHAAAATISRHTSSSNAAGNKQQAASSKQQAANRRLIHEVKSLSLLIRCKSDSVAALPHPVILHADAAAVLP